MVDNNNILAQPSMVKLIDNISIPLLSKLLTDAKGNLIAAHPATRFYWGKINTYIKITAKLIKD